MPLLLSASRDLPQAFILSEGMASAGWGAGWVENGRLYGHHASGAHLHKSIVDRYDEDFARVFKLGMGDVARDVGV